MALGLRGGGSPGERQDHEQDPAEHDEAPDHTGLRNQLEVIAVRVIKGGSLADGPERREDEREGAEPGPDEREAARHRRGRQPDLPAPDGTPDPADHEAKATGQRPASLPL